MKKNNRRYLLYQMDVNVISIVSIILLIAFVLVVFLIDKGSIYNLVNLINMNYVVLFISIFGYLVLHELLHSLAYVIYGGKFNKIIYGIELEKGILYCLCKQNITKKNILHSLLFPLIIIGVITLIISIIFIISIMFKLPLLLLLSLFNLSGCSGDLVMYAFISRLPNDIEFSELDDSTSFAIYTDKNISKISHFGIKYIKECNDISRKDLEKIKVSKLSKIILIILIILLIISCLVDLL